MAAESGADVRMRRRGVALVMTLALVTSGPLTLPAASAREYDLEWKCASACRARPEQLQHQSERITGLGPLPRSWVLRNRRRVPGFLQQHEVFVFSLSALNSL